MTSLASYWVVLITRDDGTEFIAAVNGCLPIGLLSRKDKALAAMRELRGHGFKNLRVARVSIVEAGP